MHNLAKNKRERDILEGRGLWKASSFLDNRVRSLIKKKKPLLIGFIKMAHKILFDEIGEPSIAGEYRTKFRDNGIDLRRQDGSPLKYTSWEKIPHEMGVLNLEIMELTKNILSLSNEKDYEKLISSTAHLSHKLACIHPFKNGNGRMSRLLINAILSISGLSSIPFMGHLKMEKSKLKKTYYNAMYRADEGDFSLLENFIARGIIISQNKEKEARKNSQR